MERKQAPPKRMTNAAYSARVKKIVENAMTKHLSGVVEYSPGLDGSPYFRVSENGVDVIWQAKDSAEDVEQKPYATALEKSWHTHEAWLESFVYDRTVIAVRVLKRGDCEILGEFRKGQELVL